MKPAPPVTRILMASSPMPRVRGGERAVAAHLQIVGHQRDPEMTGEPLGPSGLGRREAKPRVGAASVVPIRETGAAAVSHRDELNDRQAEATALTGPSRIRPAEPLECAGYEGRWQAGSFVEDVDLDIGAYGARTQRDGPGSVTERVVDQVEKGLLDAPDVG